MNAETEGAEKRENIINCPCCVDWKQERDELRKRVAELEQKVKMYSELAANKCTVSKVNEVLGQQTLCSSKEYNELQNRLSTVEAELKQYKNPAKGASDPAVWVELPPITDEGWQEDPRVKELESKLSTLLKASEGMEKALEKYADTETNPIGRTDIAKLALAEWDGIKEGGKCQDNKKIYFGSPNTQEFDAPTGLQG